MQTRDPKALFEKLFTVTRFSYDWRVTFLCGHEKGGSKAA
jgi:hypothetical protein